MYLAIWQLDDGSPLRTISVLEDSDGNKVGHSYESAEAKAKKAGAVDYEIILLSEMPSEDGDNLDKNRAFRDAWMHDRTDSPQKICINKSLARDISLERVRANRAVLLSDLDKEYAIAGRTGADASKLDSRRLKLLAATDRLKALDVNKDGIISVEEAAGLLLPLELIA